MIDIKDLTFEEIKNIISHLNKEEYRAKQIIRWLYKKRVYSFDEMTDLSKEFRKEIKEVFIISRLKPINILASKDGTKKYIFQLKDGRLIETILIPEKGYHTLCLSTQVGCALKCRFCVTGKLGFIRNLKTSEILNQIIAIQDDVGNTIRNIVLMGMGDPLLNYNNVVKAIKIMAYNDGLNISERRITLSTAGIINEIEKLFNEVTPNLAISLNASSDDVRNFLMPINKSNTLNKLIKTCLNLPLPRRRRITFEYVLINGINDRYEDSLRLANLLRGIKCKINLIPFNEHTLLEFKRSSPETVSRFQKVLIDHKYTTFVRSTRGPDIYGACGQLGGMLNLSIIGG